MPLLRLAPKPNLVQSVLLQPRPSPHPRRLQSHAPQGDRRHLLLNGKSNLDLALPSNPCLPHPKLVSNRTRPRGILRHPHHVNGSNGKRQPRGPLARKNPPSPQQERPEKAPQCRKKSRRESLLASPLLLLLRYYKYSHSIRCQLCGDLNL